MYSQFMMHGQKNIKILLLLNSYEHRDVKLWHY